MSFLVIGLSHKTAPVELREKLMLREDQWPELLVTLGKDPSIDEVLFLSTCNRIEFYLSTSQEASSLETVRQVLQRKGIETLEGHLYVKREGEAMAHFFRVASSLDSMVIGETQISHQVKEAYQLAIQQGTVGKTLHRLVQRAFGIAKRVRTETSIGEHPVSVSYAAVVLAEKIFGSLAGRKALLVGAGEMGELACEHLQSRGADICITNRTQEKAHALAQTFGGTTVPFADFLEHLDRFDIILTSISTERPLLTLETFRDVMTRRHNHALFVIDIAVPRNVEGTVNQLDNLFLYNIDDLKEIVESNREARSRELGEAERIIQEEVDRLSLELRADEVGPTILNLTRKFEGIRKAEVDKHLARLQGLAPKGLTPQGLTPEQREVFESCTQAIIKKILHEPIVILKTEATEGSGHSHGEFLKKIFKLD